MAARTPFAMVLLTTLLLGALGLASACSPQPVANTGSDSKTDSEAAVEVAWSPEADCATCHSAEEESRSDESCIAFLHAVTNCIDCHSDAGVLSKQHEGATSASKMPKKLKKTVTDQSQCLTCHKSYEELATKTADYQDLADEHGTVVNPHALPASESHDGLVCGDCHKMHASGSNAAEEAKNRCLSCHHEGVFECGTCHSA